MVGQVLMRGRYSYYRCRHSYGSQWDKRCDSKYVATATLEGAVMRAIADLLADPDRIIAEVIRLTGDDVETSQLERVNDALREVEARQRRLVRLFTDGGLPGDLLEEQRRELSVQRTTLEAERQRLEPQARSRIDLDGLQVCAPEYSRRLRSWLESADDDKLGLLLRATDVQIAASNTEARIRGLVPLMMTTQTQDLVTIEQTSA